MKRLLTVLILLGVLVWGVASTFKAVDETEYAIVKRFGDPVKTVMDAGLLIKWPFPVEDVVRFDNRLQVFEYPANDEAKEYLTRDKKNVETSAFACWRIKQTPEAVLKFLESVGDEEGAETRLGDLIGSELGSALGLNDFERLISTGDDRAWVDIVDGIRQSCAIRAEENYGIEIVDFRIQRLNFPVQNRKSVFDRMRSERERIAQQYRSEGREEAMKIEAQAEQEQQGILSEAMRKAETIRGEADAEATRIYNEAIAADPDFYEFLRTLEAYETGLDTSTVLILPSNTWFLRLLTEGPKSADHLLAPSSIDQGLTQDGAPDGDAEAKPQG